MVFAKAELTEVIEHLLYYQLLCLYSADVFQTPRLRKYPSRWPSLQSDFLQIDDAEKMKERIIVFGGTGDVGKIIVRKLLDQNHSVVVLTRQEKQSADNLKFVIGNALDEKIIEEIIRPSDKVIIALGFNNSSADAMSQGTANIISAMNKQGVKRLVCLSAQGAGDSWNYMPDDFKNMVLADKVLTDSFKDHDIQEDYIKRSNLDWTIVRPTEIIQGEERGTFTVNRPTDKSKYQISNSDVAQFIVTELTDNKFIRQVAMITD